MKRTVIFILAFMLSVNLTACKGPSGDQADRRGKGGEKNAPVEETSNRELAVKFIQGIQSGDKSKLYEASNLTAAVVDESREKLINSSQNKLTDKQRLEYEHALRLSGNIDFFISKLRKLFPASSAYQITQTKIMVADPDSRRFDHSVTISYNVKSEAMVDKTGKPVKTMIVHLQQIDRSVNARLIHSFSFESREFEKMADRDFEVLSYY